MEKNPRSLSLSQVKYNREREVRLEAGGVQNGQEVLFVEEVHVVEEPVEEHQHLQLKQATKIFLPENAKPIRETDTVCTDWNKEFLPLQEPGPQPPVDRPTSELDLL